MRKEPAMRTCAVILLLILMIVLFFGGFALGVYGFGSSFGAFQAPQVLQGVPQIAMGVVGVILFLASIGVSVYIWMEYPEMRSGFPRR
jgi:Kef-type K+ transport system membrane component KefB